MVDLFLLDSTDTSSGGGVLVGTAVGSIATNGNAAFAGIVTAGGGFNIGIQSAGIVIAKNVGINTLNFVGSGNSITYFAATNTLDVSIAGSSGGGGGGGVSETSTSVSSTSATSCGSFAKASKRSASILAQITQGSNIKWVDIWSYMTARLSQRLKNQQLQLDQCLEHLKV